MISRRNVRLINYLAHFGGGGGGTPILLRANLIAGADERSTLRQSTSDRTARRAGAAERAFGPICPKAAATPARTESCDVSNRPVIAFIVDLETERGSTWVVRDANCCAASVLASTVCSPRTHLITLLSCLSTLVCALEPATKQVHRSAEVALLERYLNIQASDLWIERPDYSRGCVCRG